MRSGLHNIGEGFISGRAASLHTIGQGFVRAADLGAAAIVTIAQSDNAVNTASAATYTFNTRALGTEAGNRKHILATMMAPAASRTFNTATVGGVSATRLGGAASGSPSFGVTDLWLIEGASGTSGTVEFTVTGGNATWGGFILWAVYGASSTLFDTLKVHQTLATASVTINVAANGGLIAARTWASSTAATAWTGVTEEVDVVAESNNYLSGGSADEMSAETGRTVSSTHTGSLFYNATAVISLQPS